MADLNVPGTFATITAALAAAVPGDVVVIAAGYPGNESLVVNVNNITFNAPASVTGLTFTAGTGVTQLKTTIASLSAINLNGNSGANSILGNNGANVITDGGGIANDTINSYGGADTVTVTGGTDNINTGADNDLLIVDYSADTTGVTTSSLTESPAGVHAGTYSNGVDRTVNFAAVERFQITTGTGADSITTGSGADTINGGDGDDVLRGGAGDDILNGGADNDTFDLGGASEGGDTFNGGAGTDTLRLTSNTSLSQLTLNLAASVETINSQGLGLSGTSGIDTFDLSGVTSYTFFVNILLGNGNDAFTGSQADDSADGEAGIDTLAGGLGADTLRGGADNDTVNGEAGNDSLFGDAGLDMLNGGADADTIEGGADADTLNGDAGDDILRGGAGNDILNGGADNDTFDLGGASEGVDAFNGGAGADTLRLTSNTSVSQLTLNVAASVETINSQGLGLSGTSGIDTFDLSGVTSYTFFVNILLGNGNDAFTGSQADDSADGEAGIDTLAGGLGADTLRGGADNDTVNGEAGNDSLFGDAGLDTLNGGADADTIEGGADADTLNGDAGDDILRGGAGDDILNGGADNDTFDLGGTTEGVDAFNGGAGADTLRLTSNTSLSQLTLNVAASVETINSQGLGLSGTSGADTFDLSGVTSYTFFVNILLGNGNDAFTGSQADDSADGEAGIDTLAGGLGADTLRGGADNDTVNGEAGNDSLFGDAGLDTLNGGADADTIEGGADADTLNGDAGDDVLRGGAGDDILNGGADNDTFDLGGASEGVDTFNGGAGADTLRLTSNTSVSQLTLNVAASVETINSQGLGLSGTSGIDTFDLSGVTSYTFFVNILLGNGNDAFTGSQAGDSVDGQNNDDTLSGGLGNDTLLGGANNDTLNGGDGDDTLTGGTGTDTASYAGASAAVTVSLAITIAQDTIGAGIDTITTIENLTGSSHADTLTGNTGANVIAGGDGSDTLNGGTGTDTAVFAQTWLATTITEGPAGTYQLIAGGFTDTATAFENFQFSNGTFAASTILNDAPLGVNDVNGADLVAEAGAAGPGDASAAGNLTGNDTDADAGLGDTRTVTGIRTGTELAGGALGAVAPGTMIAGTFGTLTVNPDGSWSYALDNADADTQALDTGDSVTDAFTYRVTDGKGLTDIAQLLVTIAGADDAPVGIDDVNGADLVTEAGGVANGTPGDAAAAGTVLANDTDVDLGDTRTVTGIRTGTELAGGALGPVAPGTMIVGTFGTLTINPDGTWSYALNNADADTQGLDTGSDVFTYRVADSDGLTDLAQLTIAITGANDTPTGSVFSFSIGEDSAATPALATADVDDMALTHALASGALPNGTVLNADGSLTITPSNDYDFLAVGEELVFNFTYTVSDGEATSAAIAGSITVTGVNDAPLTGADSGFITRNTTATLPLFLLEGNDADPEGDLDFVASVGGAVNGAVAIAGGEFVFTATASTVPASASFTYQSSDGTDQAPGAVALTLITTGAGTDVRTAATTAEQFSWLDGFGGIDTLTGGAGRDWLFGGTGNDILSGLAGIDVLTGGADNDRLDGGTGDDIMAGGTGIDTYTVDSSLDVIHELVGEGVDQVNAGASYTLALHLDNLTLTGAAAISGTGNDLANRIIGNGAANTLLGGAGADTLSGLGGLDTMDGQEGGDIYNADLSDIILDTGTTGIDRIVSVGGYTLATGNGVEQLQVKPGNSAVNIILAGNELNNTIIGNDGASTMRGHAGNDTLLGNGGIDRLEGGLGRDVMTGGTGADIFDFDAGGTTATAFGFDTIEDFVSGVGGDRIDLDVTIGGGQYASTDIMGQTFANALSAAQLLMNGGAIRATFVGNGVDGWLFWSQDATFTTIEQAVRLNGVGASTGFAAGDLI